MTSPTISVALMVRNEKEFLRECLTSALPIMDELVIIIDDRSNDGTIKIIEDFVKDYKVKCWREVRKWTTGAEQKQYLLKKCTQDWILFLDGDEILSDDAGLLRGIIQNNKYEAFSIRGHHFIYSLLWEDSSVERHYWEARLVKNKPELKMTGINHAILEGFKPPIGVIDQVQIYHMGYVKHLFKIVEKYERDMRIQQIHTPEFLESWKNAHVLGQYPRKSFTLNNLPLTIKKKFHLEDNEKA